MSPAAKTPAANPEANKGPAGNPAQAQADKKAAEAQAAKDLQAVDAKAKDTPEQGKPNTAQESANGAAEMMKELAGDLPSGALKEFRTWIDSVLKSREAGEIAEARKQILAIAQSVGVPLDQLLGHKKGPVQQSLKLPGAAVPVKYKNPANPEQTWTGRGRAPAWVKEYLDANGGNDAGIKV